MDYAVAVKKIIAAENEAQRQAAEAKERVRRLLGEQLEADKAKLKKEYEARVAVRLQKLKAFEEAVALEERKQIEQDHDQCIAALEANYAANRNAWVQRLFAYIIGEPLSPNDDFNHSSGDMV